MWVLTQRVGERMIGWSTGGELLTSVSQREGREHITTHTYFLHGIRAIISTTIGTDGKEA